MRRGRTAGGPRGSSARYRFAYPFYAAVAAGFPVNNRPETGLPCHPSFSTATGWVFVRIKNRRPARFVRCTRTALSCPEESSTRCERLEACGHTSSLVLRDARTRIRVCCALLGTRAPEDEDEQRLFHGHDVKQPPK